MTRKVCAGAAGGTAATSSSRSSNQRVFRNDPERDSTTGTRAVSELIKHSPFLRNPEGKKGTLLAVPYRPAIMCLMYPKRQAFYQDGNWCDQPINPYRKQSEAGASGRITCEMAISQQ